MAHSGVILLPIRNPWIDQDTIRTQQTFPPVHENEWLLSILNAKRGALPNKWHHTHKQWQDWFSGSRRSTPQTQQHFKKHFSLLLCKATDWINWFLTDHYLGNSNCWRNQQPPQKFGPRIKDLHDFLTAVLLLFGLDNFSRQNSYFCLLGYPKVCWHCLIQINPYVRNIKATISS